MNKSETIGKLAEALSKAQGAMKPAIKDSDNPYYKSKYADLSSVWEAIREPLSANGLSVSQLLESTENGDRITLTTILMHSSGEWLMSSITAKPAKEDAQAIGSLTSYLRRYALSAIVGGYADDDDAEVDRIARQEKSAEAEQQKEPPKAAPPIAKPQKKPLTPAQSKLWVVLQQKYGDDKEAMKERIFKETSFVNKEGKKIDGKTSIYDIKDTSCDIIRHKIERELKKEGEGQDKMIVDAKEHAENSLCKACKRRGDCELDATDDCAQYVEENFDAKI